MATNWEKIKKIVSTGTAEKKPKQNFTIHGYLIHFYFTSEEAGREFLAKHKGQYRIELTNYQLELTNYQQWYATVHFGFTSSGDLFFGMLGGKKAESLSSQFKKAKKLFLQHPNLDADLNAYVIYHRYGERGEMGIAKRKNEEVVWERFSTGRLQHKAKA